MCTVVGRIVIMMVVCWYYLYCFPSSQERRFEYSFHTIVILFITIGVYPNLARTLKKKSFFLIRSSHELGINEPVPVQKVV